MIRRAFHGFTFGAGAAVGIVVGLAISWWAISGRWQWQPERRP